MTSMGNMRFILASESARRVDLLSLVGYRFGKDTSGFPEETLQGRPVETVERNARGKAITVARSYPADVVLGADTIVYIPGEGEILGQAHSDDDVRRMLGKLAGRTHEVYTGVAVAADGEITVRRSVTQVRMREISTGELDAYIELGEGIGKAGGYAIQGTAALFVEWIGGDYSNVVGLPLSLTCRMLEDVGVRWH